MITKKMIELAYEEGIIELINTSGGVACQIGNNFFFFGGTAAEEMNAAEFQLAIPEDVIIDDILTTLNSFNTSLYPVNREEYMYYEQYLNGKGLGPDGWLTPMVEPQDNAFTSAECLTVSFDDFDVYMKQTTGDDTIRLDRDYPTLSCLSDRGVDYESEDVILELLGEKLGKNFVYAFVVTDEVKIILVCKEGV